MFRIDADDEPSHREGSIETSPRGDPDMSVSDALIRRSSRARRWLGLTAAIVITMTLTAGSASATVGERERVFKNPYEFTAWDCGYPMQVVGVETHFIHVRTDRRVDGNVFFTNNYSWRETWTAADGRSFTISGNGIFKDVKAQVPGRFAVPVRVPRERSAVRHQELVLARSSPATAGTHRELHVRLRDRRVQLPRKRAPWATSDVRCRPVQGRGTAHRDQ